MRSKIISSVKKIVIKVGTNVVTSKNGLLDKKVIAGLAEQVVQLRERGYYVVMVSSGAIGAGLAELGIKTRPKTLPQLQAAAAVGQCKLISFYDESFTKHGYHAAQLLLTRQDFEDRRRYLNASNTINALMKFNAIPVINENDTISVDEIAFSDNDILSSLVTNLLQAELFIILSSVDGLYSEISSDGKGTKLVNCVEDINSDIKKLACDIKTKSGVGGMQSKLEAAKTATKAGEAVIIANGKKKNILLKIMNGENVGTLFLPAKTKMSCRKRWIRFSVKPSGRIVVDNGAEEALTKNGKSLLASGIVDLEGDFQRGDMVSVIGKNRQLELGRGLTNYSSDEIRKVKGLKTSEIRKVLGSKTYDEVVHRNNLVIDN
ncbi:MAG: glutamate 5-kinase [Candidatus Anammoxibacter sp.]